MSITIIDFGVTPEQIENFQELPKKCQELLKNNRLESRGFQEVLGFDGRQLVFACGGYWNEDENSFHITSIGDGTQLFVEGDEKYYDA